MIATAVALGCLPAAAQDVPSFYSGNLLWSHCTSNSAYEVGLCRGYVAGIADVMALGTAIFGFRACLPQHVTTDQTQDVVKRLLEQHPEGRHYTAASLAAQALALAFPCPP
jgi:hypothetical protein